MICGSTDDAGRSMRPGDITLSGTRNLARALRVYRTIHNANLAALAWRLPAHACGAHLG
jgi:hypothetical protein